MKNIDLTEEEFNLIINYRKGKYNIDISDEEYNEIVSHRNSVVNTYVKYIENIQKLIDQENKFVSDKAREILVVSNSLHENKISIDEYKKIEHINYTGEDQDTSLKIGFLNYIIDCIPKYYPN